MDDSEACMRVLGAAMENTARLLAAQALAITSQDWNCLGFSDDTKVSPSDDVDTLSERILSLLAIRMVALLSTLDDFQDFSTTTICRSLLIDSQLWPRALSQEVIDELRDYITRIIRAYSSTAPYHNRQHAFHVTLSTNKLLDLMLLFNPSLATQEIQGLPPDASINTVTSQRQESRKAQTKIPKTYGLRRDTLLQFAVVFAALIHDVQHQGISNRQLAIEDDPLSLLYNDTSTLEQQSLTIGFTELMQPEFAKLRKVLFPTRQEYTDFRKVVVNLVLATDIANPEKMQLTKDKWKTTFADTIAAGQNEEKVRRESCFTEISMPKKNASKPSSRRSIGSVFSDITVDVNAAMVGSTDEDEVSFSETLESSEDGAADLGHSLRSANSDDGADTYSSDGLPGKKSHLPDTAPSDRGLAKIEESNNPEKVEINLQELGYSISKATATSDHTPPNPNTARGIRIRRGNRRGSTTSVPENPGSLPVLRPNAFRRRRASIAAGENQMKRMQRRLSSGSAYSTGDLGTKKFRLRLGIMRTVDLTGETIENYPRKGSMRSAPFGGESKKTHGKRLYEEYDEPDELRASVVLETLLVGADVAHNLQSWNHMIKWSHKLYWELVKANEAGRGFDPSVGWYSSQIGFLEGYMLPLAQKLCDTGVFGPHVGATFPQNVEGILEMWKTYGASATALLMRHRDFDPLRNGLSYADMTNQNGNSQREIIEN